MSKLHDLIDEMKEQDVFEDRREYSIKDLEKMYSLSLQEAEDLQYLIQREFDLSISTIPISHIPSWVHKEYFLESEHGGYEGFTEHEQVVIQKWYDDMSRYWRSAKLDKDRDPITGRPPNVTYGSPKADQ